MPGAIQMLALNAAADLLRFVCAPMLQRRCRRCLVSLSTSEPDQPLCVTCESEGPPPPPARAAASHDALAVSIRQAVEGRKGRSAAFDAILLNSGGKDSLYMLIRLRREFPDLTLLSVSFDNGFLNPLSLRNIEQVCAAEGVASLVIRPDPAIYRAIIGYGIRASGTIGCYRVDSMDGAIFRDLASLLAAERRIPLVFSGHTWAQTRTILGIDDFRLPADFLAADRTDYFGIPVADIFGDRTEHVWKGSRVDPSRIPHWIFPMHVWRPSQQEIESLLAEAGFAAARVKQYFTGNALQSVFLLHDWRTLGRFSYETEAAMMLRHGLVDRREWRRIYALMEIAGRSALLTRAFAKAPLDRLGLNYRELFPPHRRTRRSQTPAPPDPLAGAPH